ncbi:RraA family protein [Roseomonas sp. OT10]|uniref:RraA family protein n=1 Tax=Roseomonas cutis TaxID=2897332 RepID=UPI001E500702|nr:RraA family protein [Roseomonas sp. OT10]UFN47671.1 RraA family protein [Roseomonas sp. OT10]
MTGAAPILRTTHLADAADRIGLPGPVAAGGFTAFGQPGRTAVGRAYTVLQEAVHPAPDEATPPTRHGEAAASLAAPGDVLVIAVQGETDAASWGGAHTLRATRRGLAGVVVDGFTRDAEELAAAGIRILARGAAPHGSRRRLRTVSVGEEVRVGGITVRSGDLVALDADGFVCIPAAHAGEAMALARSIAEAEFLRDSQL